MSATTDEPVTQNGVLEHEKNPVQVPEPEIEHEPQPEPQSEPNSEPQPEPDSEATSVADPKLDEPKETSIQSNDESQTQSSPSAVQEASIPELRKDVGNRTFTMRELLSGLKSEQGNDGSYDASSPYRQNKRHMIFGTYRQNLLWMNPPALEKMDDAKPVILVSKSSRIVSGDVDPFEARFVDFCKNGLALDASSYTEAIKSFKETKDVLSTNVCAIGSGTHEAERFWFSLVLYTIKKLCHKDIDNMQQAYHDNGITLCQIFKAAKLNIADFFKELPQFVVKAGSILSKLYGTEWENRPEFLPYLLCRSMRLH